MFTYAPMKTLLLIPIAIATAALSSCAGTDWFEGARIAPGSEYGYGTENGNHPPYRSDGRVIAANRARNSYYGNGSPSLPYDSGVNYNRSPYGGGVDNRYRNVYPTPYVNPGYGYPGYGYPGYGYPYGYPAGRYGRW